MSFFIDRGFNVNVLSHDYLPKMSGRISSRGMPVSDSANFASAGLNCLFPDLHIEMYAGLTLRAEARFA